MDILSMYDDIAVDVVSDDEPNTDAALSLSNKQLCGYVCDTMDWESFDLFEEHNFDMIEETGTTEQMLAYAYLAFLRWRVFTTATDQGVGDEVFNQTTAAHSEMWYIRLVSAWNTRLNPSTPVSFSRH